MAALLADFLKSVLQFRDRRFLRVLLIGVALTIALLVAISAAVLIFLGWLLPDAITLPWIGTISFFGAALSWAAVPFLILLSSVMMVPVASAFTGLFLDEIADAVEAEHYPQLPPARHVKLAEAIGDSLRFLGVILLANTLALVLYFTPFAPFVFWGLNGFLLGREYSQMVAQRRLDRVSAIEFRRKNRLTFFAGGVMMALPLSVPILNLIVPILGAATFTHMAHRVDLAGARQ